MTTWPPPVRVIVVAYNSARYLPACLESLLAQDYPAPVAIHVVDNGSTDDTRRALEPYASRIAVDYAGTNLGFPRAVNRALKKCREEVVVLLNPDTEMERDWLAQLVGALRRHPGAGAAGSLLFYPDGSIQHAGGRIFANGLTSHERALPAVAGEERVVDYATGAALAVRADVLRALGGLDQGYPLYGEDVQLAAHLARRGLSTLLVPAARGVHHESVGSVRESCLYLYRLHRARLRWSALNFPLSHLLGRWLNEEFYYLRVAGMFSTYRFWPVLAAYLTTLARLPWLLFLRARGPYRVREQAFYQSYLHRIISSGIRALAEEYRRARAAEAPRA
ncbi:glycosyltransferase family 2 protein [bacterium]|nr:glycosyltransferase family 2 protein [bacterium]